MPPDDFDYALPKALIAQRPLPQRDASRLLVVRRPSGGVEDKKFTDIADYFHSGDCLVLNDTKVFPAKILARKKLTGGKAELLLLAPAGPEGKNIWKCLLQPALKAGQEILLESTPVEAVVLERGRDGIPRVEFKTEKDVAALAETIGLMPLPPYIKREPDKEDKECYQTVYAQKPGAVAAPTAGLHFTPELLKKIEACGVKIARVTLHVGYGTFKPVEDPETHQMHAETFELSEEAAQIIRDARSGGREVWAVGTTTLRVLETCVQGGKLIPGKGETNLFIREPFKFEVVDHLVTNFHLPKTTLLMLVSAFMGSALRKKSYAHAIENGYRFYSFGDAMLIL
ncbi:MAG: tRNA preQ1(34) S-adenosylmethionine ribosyltransferase-isomerase QueA [Candidatus Omnitrophica bacterium]|nr:tRNA preQ1(34) S-adenosylmethionine ribosyltransferase-isomerase QueA [Candidatus Omnitrophota bacterium]